MKVRKFRGKDFKEVMEEIKKTLGEDALILSTKTENDMVEVLAAVDFDWDKIEDETPRKGIDIIEEIKASENSLDGNITKSHGWDKILVEIEEIRNTLVSYAKKYRELERLKKDISEIKKLLSKGVNLLDVYESLDEEAFSLFLRLREMEVEDNIIKKIFSEIKETKSLPARSVADRFISNSIKTAKFEPLPGVPNVFVGPTGVGKTTTIAKIASILKFFSGIEVAIISIDTYRIGAIDQMKIYADLLDIDFFTADTPSEFMGLINRLKDRIILVDTAGRSPKDEIRMSELSAFLSNVEEYKLYLLISYNCRLKEAIKVVESFSLKKPDGLILTKLDETDIFGLPLNLSVFLNIPIVFVTTGQKVPEDIETPDVRKMSRLILGLEA